MIRRNLFLLAVAGVCLFGQEAEVELWAQAPPAPPAPAARPSPAPVPAAAPRAPRPPRPASELYAGPLDPKAPEDLLYRRGSYFVDRREWDRAIEAYDAAVAKNGSKADGALYWKAYALAKAGRFRDAEFTLTELHAKHPSSRWADDARALAMDIKQSQGRPVSPEDMQDEELKLMAIHSLSMQDPARALPLLEKVISGSASPRVKQQALYVLGLSAGQQSKELLLKIARGGANPDLQMSAIQLLAMTATASSELASIYGSTSDKSAKRMILDMLAMQKDAKPLVDIARSEKDPELRRAAIQRLMATNRKEATEFAAEILEK